MNIFNPNDKIRVAFISSYPPRRCGIATFSNDLLEALNQNYNGIGNSRRAFQVVAIDNTVPVHAYSEEVTFVVGEQNIGDFIQAGGFLNSLPIDIVSLQHEFNLYGGNEGGYILNLISKINKPVITTLHTILPNPSPDQKMVLREVCAFSASIVVMSQRAKFILQQTYSVPADKIKFIHHGVKDVPLIDPSHYKSRLNLGGKPVILTFGLLDHNKGIEYVIDAMKEVTRDFPKATFVILGTTHPAILKHHGEAYLDSLKSMVREKGLAGNVIFHNKFISLTELTEFMMAADIFITPYPNKERISSGTLAFALGCGKAIISTPYFYAEEMLANNRGRLVPFKNTKAIAKEILMLLHDEKLRNKIRENAYRFSRQMVWKEVAGSYMKTFTEAALECSVRSDLYSKGAH